MTCLKVMCEFLEAESAVSYVGSEGNQEAADKPGSEEKSAKSAHTSGLRGNVAKHFLSQLS